MGDWYFYPTLGVRRPGQIVPNPILYETDQIRVLTNLAKSVAAAGWAHNFAYSIPMHQLIIFRNKV
jgi:hypothetical protein